MSNVNSCGKVQSFGDLAWISRKCPKNRAEIRKLMAECQELSRKGGLLAGVEMETRRGTQTAMYNRGRLVSNVIAQKVNTLA